jgi:membrane-bound ClpP family serine protease
MWTVLTLILVGAALLLLETILPGLIAGFLGMCALMAAIVLGYSNYGPAIGSWILLGVCLGLLVGTGVWLKYFPESRLARVFISQRIVGDLNVGNTELVGHKGVAQTNLRPSGIASIDGQRVDVVTEGGLVERGANVEVVAVEGMRVVVRAVESIGAERDQL